MTGHDVLVVGGGGAGLRAAIAAHEAGADVAVVSQLHPVRSHTGAAEGGINAVFDESDSAELHAYDTMKGADYLADAPAVEVLAADAPEEVVQLEHWGMTFSRTEAGTLGVRPLAGHSAPRTVYAGAETGHHLLQTLYEQVLRRGIQVYDEHYVLDLAVTEAPRADDRTCHGVVAYDIADGTVRGMRATHGVVLATGGLGQVYEGTTNAVANTGDGQALAYRAGVPLEDMEMIQFHPTTLPSTGVLISEGVRGEGGILYNADGERFMFEHGYAVETGELASRDVVSRAELTEVRQGRGFEDEYVMLDMRHLGEERIRDRLENILHLAEDFEGVDGLKEPMPVRPGQHFAMGGIETDEHCQTCIDGLYAAGECACASVHGSNRLGGNALPELLVFGARAGRAATSGERLPASVPIGAAARSDARDVSESIPAGVPASARESREPVGDGGETVRDASTVVDRAVERARERVTRLRERDGTSHAVIRERLQETMEANANVFRDREGLRSALETIRECRRRYRDVGVADPSRTYNTDLVHTIETRNLLDVAEAIALGAFVREESRGAHWREDHPSRDDDGWLAHTLLVWNDGRPEVAYGDVVLSGEHGEYEPTERSY